MAFTFTITIEHDGTAAEAAADGRRFLKRTQGILNVGREVPYTAADIDAAASAKLQKGVGIVMSRYFDEAVRAQAVEEADAVAVEPVRAGGPVVTIPGGME